MTNDWLDKEEHWRIAICLKQCRWYPKFIFSYIREWGHNDDLEQTVALAVLESLRKGLDIVETGKLFQARLRKFLRALGFRKGCDGKGNNQWVLAELVDVREMCKRFLAYHEQ